MAIDQVIDSVGGEIILPKEPRFVPALSHVVQAVIGSIDEDDAGPLMTSGAAAKPAKRFWIRPAVYDLNAKTTLIGAEPPEFSGCIRGDQLIGY